MKKRKMLTVPLLLFASISTLALRGTSSGDSEAPIRVPIRTGQVVAHIVGRLLVDGGGSAEFVGYYPYILGLNGSLFSGTPNETTAYFTFRSSSFGVQVLPNGNILHLFTIPATGTTNLLNVYFNENPKQSFDDPDSFSSGRLVAQFQTERSMATYFGTGASQLGTIDLISSKNFRFQGQLHNFGQIQSATVNMSFPGAPLSGSVSSGPAVIPFGGSLVAVGPTQAPEHDDDSFRR